MTTHTALLLPGKRTAFAIGPAPSPQPLDDQVVIRARAVAVNPFERLIQSVGDVVTPWLRYPVVAGTDVAGEVVAVGKDVTRFSVGDRVVGFAAGTEKSRNVAAQGAFQQFVVLSEKLTTPLPDAMRFEEACVLPLGLITAAAALFQSDFLALERSLPRGEAIAETVIVWGGSTTVGSNAIQLAVAAGYDVVATTSPRNFAYAQRLGARVVFDYRETAVVDRIVSALRGRRVAGAVAIGTGSARPCIDIVSRSDGRRFVAMVSPPASFDSVERGSGRWRTLVPALVRMIAGNAALAVKAKRRRAVAKFVWGGAPIDNDVGPLILEHFLPSALADGRFIPAPPPEVVGHGLQAIPEALDRQRQGVSATKLVVTL